MNSISKASVISLLRSFMRNANKFANYNFREHAKRRALGAFRQNQSLPSDLARDEYLKGKEQLEIVRRQAIISGLFSEGASVVQAGKRN